MVRYVVPTAASKNRWPPQGQMVGRLRREYRYYKALMDDPRTPKTAKWLIGGGVGYMVLPFDLIPDFIPIIGKLDDMLIVPALIGLGMMLVPDGVKNENRSRSRRVRILNDDDSIGPVLFESAALAGPFGIRLDTRRCNIATQGPILFPLLDLMFEYGLVVISDERRKTDGVDSYTIGATSRQESGPCKKQIQLDMNFRRLPRIAAVMQCCNQSDCTDQFVNSEAAYVALPPKLKSRIGGLQMRFQPCQEIQLNAVVNVVGSVSSQSNSAHEVSGAQLINLLINEDSEIIDVSYAGACELREELREHVCQDRFCYSHQCLDGDLITWNPRKVLHLQLSSSTNTTQYIYPRDLGGAL